MDDSEAVKPTGRPPRRVHPFGGEITRWQVQNQPQAPSPKPQAPSPKPLKPQLPRDAPAELEVVAAAVPEHPDTDLHVIAGGADVHLWHHHQLSGSGGTRQVGLHTDRGLVAGMEEERVVGQPAVAGPAVPVLPQPVHGEHTPARMPARTGQVEQVELHLAVATGFALPDALPAVNEGAGSRPGQGTLHRQLQAVDLAVLHRQFELDPVTLGEGVLHLGRPGQLTRRPIRRDAEQRVDLQFTAFRSQRADEVEHHGFGDPRAHARQRALIRIERRLGRRGGGDEGQEPSEHDNDETHDDALLMTGDARRHVPPRGDQRSRRGNVRRGAGRRGSAGRARRPGDCRGTAAGRAVATRSRGWPPGTRQPRRCDRRPEWRW
jgi:hypothetical protein